MRELINYFGAGGVVALFLSVFVEISPIKINPISWLGSLFNKDIMKSMNKINEKLDDHIVKSFRNDILSFQEKLLFDDSRTFTREQWNVIIDTCKKYEEYCKDNDIQNGQIEEATIYIRASYQKALMKKNFKDVPLR